MSFIESALSNKDYQTALNQANQALNEDQNPQILANRARAYIGLGNLENANNDIQFALSLDSNSPYPYAALGELQLKQQDYQSAANSFEKASSLNNDRDQHLSQRLDGELSSMASLLGESVSNDRTLGESERGLGSTLLNSVVGNNNNSQSGKFQMLAKLFMKNSGHSTGGAGSQSLGSLGPMAAALAAGAAGSHGGNSSGGISSLLSSFGGKTGGGNSSGLSSLINSFTGSQQGGHGGQQQQHQGGSGNNYSQYISMAQQFMGPSNGSHGSNGNHGGSGGSGGFSQYASMAQQFMGSGNGSGNNHQNGGGKNNFSQFASMAQGFMNNQGGNHQGGNQGGRY